jgi:hypothetical protein
VWDGRAYAWVPGRYIIRHGHWGAYEPGHWAMRGGVWVWVPPHWR